MSRYKRVPLNTLKVDERYQRPLDEKRVEKMVDDFDERLFGVLEISHRNGKAAVFDGQHRLAVARRLGHKDVPCIVHTGLEPEQEAELFVSLQRDRRGINQIDRFKARCFMGDEDALNIAKIVEAWGFKIGPAGAEAGESRTFKAVTSLERVYRRGILSETLSLMSDLWGGDVKSTDGGLLEGVALLILGYGHRLDEAETARLRATAPVVILRRAIGHSGGGSAKGTLVLGELRKVAGLRGRARKTETVEAE